ncbi:hypothetical protein FHX75_11807 [Micromonospora palomenae]|uniref:DUF11 domain-containing protein n=1 Tax=Micromonospora palomenae TaxID=1461247 RepID=A0A561WUX0_9ACTN|nr:hypothetical protein [Micromonospora palomenae]TWG27659.1 hypothetical protein FHX75_11807 [Micromonospora palomenae]
MWESIAAPAAGLMAAMAAALPTPPPSVDAAPVLTSTPFGALPGQQVTHTVTISGSGTLTTTRVTFTTTVDLDGVTARAEPGRCAASPRTVVCDLGDLRLGPAGAAPRITISGRVRPGAPPGTVVRNRVDVTSVETTATGARTTSNAYLLPGSTATPTDPRSTALASEVPPPGRSMRLPALAAAAVAGAVAAAALLTRRRLRRRPGSPPADRL